MLHVRTSNTIQFFAIKEHQDVKALRLLIKQIGILGKRSNRKQ